MAGARIDTDLYSRQIGTLGMETMGKLVQMKVLISGLRGAGVETAKNLILAGPAAVVLHDDSIVEARDLGANFYLGEADVGQRSRAVACATKLAELNPYVAVSVHTGPISEDVLSGFSIAVFSEASQADLIRWNAFCRAQSPVIGFIAMDCFGVAGRIFVDYGDAFTCRDNDGEEPKSAILAGVTQESPGTVHTHNEKRHGLQSGDWVTFREVHGMTQLNGSPPRQIEVTGPFSFTIEDTTGYSPYLREGIVTQVKVAHSIKFASYEQCCRQPKGAGGQELHVPDLAKFGRSEQLHVAIQALLEFRQQQGRLPVPRDAAEADACVAFAKAFNAARQQEGAEAAVSLEELDEEVVKKVALFSQCMICPMSAFAGGIVAQEIVKFTGKYTPLGQCLYFDMFELLPQVDPGDCQPLGGRYDDQIAIFGQAFQRKLGEMKLFLVGAGALGCEYIKNFALMGACCGEQGNVTVTDMDRIEVSNLNRQFLFRQSDVGNTKSATAAKAAQAMNRALKVNSMEARVGNDTEETFNDAFWESLDGVVNALDNIHARMYVDSRCVWFATPLLESGTLGTKANSQVILPHLTQSYADSQDPPEDSIPLCTLRHFPNTIEHTIEWSREFFEQLFVEAPKEVNAFLTEPQALLSKVLSEGSGTSQLARLNGIKRALEQRDGPFELCVRFGVLEFQDKFHDGIAQLLHTFPKDHKTSEGQVFWSGPKRAPSPVPFDPNDDVHIEFVLAAANLYATSLGVPMLRDKEQVRQFAEKVRQQVVTEFKAKDVKFKVDDKDTSQEGCADDDELAKALRSEMEVLGKRLKEGAPTSAGSAAAKPLIPAQFEKDDDSNFHVAFIAASANLRARNYKIEEVDFFKVKMIAGKIIPAIATTTAMITGLMSAELLKLVDLKSRKVEDFKNAFVNLALPLWVISEPLPPLKTVNKEYDPIVMGPVRAKPEGFTTWDKVLVNKGDLTLKGLNDFLMEEYNVEVLIISAGNACIYNQFSMSHKKRLGTKITELWENVAKVKIPASKNYLTLEVSCSDADDGVEIQLPAIKFQFR